MITLSYLQISGLAAVLLGALVGWRYEHMRRLNAEAGLRQAVRVLRMGQESKRATDESMRLVVARLQKQEPHAEGAQA